MRVFVRIAGTVAVTVLLCYPLWAPHWERGVLGETAALGTVAASAVTVVFLGVVALYCRALQRTLGLVRPEARTGSPASVWWMFAIPYNFTEDFFIVRTVATSLAGDGRMPGRFVRWWAVLGYGWCGFQILSLFPGAAGHAGGALAVPPVGGALGHDGPRQPRARPPVRHRAVRGRPLTPRP
ncbi:hypothetical protein [Streptomyces somaliensis]|uniref:hypothetical protein n=1 Tax=Streptomyces somaliensis TaxID=78355 RepID=UPI0034E940DD